MNEQGAGAVAAPPGAVSRPPSKAATIRSAIGPMLANQRGSVALLVVASILSALAESALLAVFAETAATIATGAGRAHIHLPLLHLHPTIGVLFAVALGLVVFRLVVQVPLTILPARIVTNVQARMRRGLFEAYTHASWEVQSRDREGQLQETMTGQIAQSTAGVQGAMGLVSSTLVVTVLLATSFALNPLAASFVVVLTVALLALLRPVRRAGVRRSRALSGAQVQYARGIAESIRLAEETQVFGAEEAQRGQIKELVAQTRANAFATQVLVRLAANLYSTVIFLLFVCTLLLLYELGHGHAASLAAVVLIMVRAASSGQNVQAAYQGLIQAMPFVERVQEAERRYREGVGVFGSVGLDGVRSLVFEGVGYAYTRGRPVLSGVSFEVAGGEVVGVIGPSGAGKSTLVQLLLRLREPVEGRYLVNGVLARDVLLADWHRRVAYVPQEPRLLHASVAANIRFFRDVSDEDVERAARLARIHDDIVGWRDGYATVVGPRADAVSGGQQQRICLARALVARPELLVLDEPTSALDPTSEALIQESLTGLKEDLTMFIVAHRMSTLNICDRVMIILDGRLVAFDTIEQLAAHNEYYRHASALATSGPTGGMLP